MYPREDGELEGNQPFSANFLVGSFLLLCCLFSFCAEGRKKWIFRAVKEFKKKETEVSQ